VICGSPNNGGAYGCVGPQGKVGSPTADPPPDSATFTTTITATLVEYWNGSSWVIQPSPNRDLGRNALKDVWCWSSTSCEAVGGDTNYSDQDHSALAQRWDGTSWKNQAVNSLGDLTGISCPSTTSCTAVGTRGGPLRGVVATHWNGSTWADQTISWPGNGQLIRLDGVSCTSDTACMAVGSYFDTSMGVTRTLTERWNGTSWTLGGALDLGAGTELHAVWCTAATTCLAAGNYNRGDGNSGLVERWDGSSWTVQTTPNPSGSGQNRELDGLTCTSSTACTAVGVDENGATESSATLAERWNGTSWVVQATPSPLNRNSALTDVSCVSSTACAAVGNYLDGLNQPQTLIERWNGTSWTIQTTPTPPSGKGSPSGIFCISTDTCTAVGTQ
jgi:hypothetical protein